MLQNISRKFLLSFWVTGLFLCDAVFFLPHTSIIILVKSPVAIFLQHFHFQFWNDFGVHSTPPKTSASPSGPSSPRRTIRCSAEVAGINPNSEKNISVLNLGAGNRGLIEMPLKACCFYCVVFSSFFRIPPSFFWRVCFIKSYFSLLIQNISDFWTELFPHSRKNATLPKNVEKFSNI